MSGVSGLCATRRTDNPKPRGLPGAPRAADWRKAARARVHRLRKGTHRFTSLGGCCVPFKRTTCACVSSINAPSVRRRGSSLSRTSVGSTECSQHGAMQSTVQQRARARRTRDEAVLAAELAVVDVQLGALGGGRVLAGERCCAALRHGFSPAHGRGRCWKGRYACSIDTAETAEAERLSTVARKARTTTTTQQQRASVVIR